MFRQFLVGCTAALMTAVIAASSSAAEINRARDPQGNVVAVSVTDAALVHTEQLIPLAESTTQLEQGEQVLGRLAEVLKRLGARRSDVVKLNVYVRDPGTRKQFVQRLSDWFGADAPAVSFVASTLPRSEAAIGLDAVIAVDPKTYSVVAVDDKTSVLPVGDVIYVSGQASSGDLREATRETMAGLLKTIEHLGVTASDIVQVKCFVKPISGVAIADAAIASALGQAKPPIVYVQWASTSRAIEIELIVAARHQPSPETVTYITPPWMKSSPVFSRAARIHGNERIYVAGLYPKEARDGASQVKSIFAQLKTALGASGSDLRHLAKATYYVSDDDASAQLNQLRPSYYDPLRPPAASKATVQSVAAEGRGITIDIIAAPTTNGAVRVIKDVAYLGDDRNETMDLYLPASENDSPRPAIVIIHGGGWHGGDKAARREQNIAGTLAGAGYVCASINYELGQKSDHLGERLRSVWPRNLHDCKTAVRFLRAHANEYEIDVEHIGAIGGSAGGHLVAMLATTDSGDGFDDSGKFIDQSSRIQAVVPMYGVHDVVAQARTKGNEMTEQDIEICRHASPVAYVTSDDPPALILHGTQDALVPVEQSQILHDRLRAAAIPSELVIIEGAPHSFHLQPKQRDLRQPVIRFFDEHLKRAP